MRATAAPMLFPTMAATMLDTKATPTAHTHWLTYAELADRLDITGESARNLVRRRGWPRKPGNDGTQRIGVPADYLEERAREEEATAPPIEAPIIAAIIPPVEGENEGATVAALEAHIDTLKAVLEHERARADVERQRADAERDRADRIAAELAQVRANGAEQVADVERHVAELRKVVEAMKAPAAEARAREAALESKIEAVRAEAASLRDRPWWRWRVG